MAATVMAAAAVRLSDRFGLSAGTGSTANDFILLSCITLASAATYLVLTFVLRCDEVFDLIEYPGQDGNAPLPSTCDG